MFPLHFLFVLLFVFFCECALAVGPLCRAEWLMEWSDHRQRTKQVEKVRKSDTKRNLHGTIRCVPNDARSARALFELSHCVFVGSGEIAQFGRIRPTEPNTTIDKQTSTRMDRRNGASTCTHIIASFVTPSERVLSRFPLLASVGLTHRSSSQRRHLHRCNLTTSNKRTTQTLNQNIRMRICFSTYSSLFFYLCQTLLLPPPLPLPFWHSVLSVSPSSVSGSGFESNRIDSRVDLNRRYRWRLTSY